MRQVGLIGMGIVMLVATDAWAKSGYNGLRHSTASYKSTGTRLQQSHRFRRWQKRAHRNEHRYKRFGWSARTRGRASTLTFRQRVRARAKYIRHKYFSRTRSGRVRYLWHKRGGGGRHRADRQRRGVFRVYASPTRPGGLRSLWRDATKSVTTSKPGPSGNPGLKSLQLAAKREIHRSQQRRTVIKQNDGRDFRDRF